MRPTVRHIQETVAEHFEVDPKTMWHFSRNVFAHENLPRHVGMFFARQVTHKSRQNIANLFGRRDHTTVIHAEQKVEELAKSDPTFADELATLRAVIGS